MAITDGITTTDLDKVIHIQLVSNFTKNLQALHELLGINTITTIPNGYAIDVYKTTGTLKSGTVGEFEEVPLTKVQRKIAKTIKAVINKWRKETSEEAIVASGYEEAVAKTDAEMLEWIQDSIRTAFFSMLATGTGTADAGEDIQGALAKVEGKLLTAASQGNYSSSDLVYFANPEDVTDYLAEAPNYNRESVAGWRAVKDFLGLGTVVLDHNVPKGTVYGTFARNLRAYKVDLSGLNFGTSQDFYSDETGLIGIAHEPDRTYGGYMTHYRSGVQYVPEYLDLIFKGEISGE